MTTYKKSFKVRNSFYDSAIQTNFLILFFLILSIFLVYFQVLKYGFVYDDSQYILYNSNIQNGLNLKSIKWAFFSIELSNWHPLTWISHIIDVSFYGLNAGGHHFTNLIIHTLNSIIFYFIVLRISKNNFLISSFACFLFALHPLHIESVAWIAERKDVLSTFFGFSSIYIYLEYIKHKQKSLYFSFVLAFVLSLMSKAMFVTLPFLLLLFDFFLKRFKERKVVKLILEKVPLFVVSFFSSIIIFFAQSKGEAVKTFEEYPFLNRLTNASLSYFKYLYKTFYPKNLAIPYIYDSSLSPLLFFLCLFSIIFITYIFFKLRKKKPYLIFGWLWYLGTLVPVIGIVQIGSQPIADRYTYLPLCGIFILLAFFFYDLFKRRKSFYLVFSISIILILTTLSFFQVKYWKNPMTLFNHTIKVTEKEGKINLTAHNNLAVFYFDKGQLKKSINHSLIVLEKTPNDLFALNNVGLFYIRLGEFKMAEKYFLRALKINYNDADTHNNYANIFFRSKNFEKAIPHFKEAFKLEPSNALFCSNIGGAYANMGNFEEALKYFKRAYEIEPHNPDMKSNYFRALQDLERQKHQD